MPEMDIDIPCPTCGHRPMVQRYAKLTIPYFDEAFETSLRCRECLYTNADVMITSVKEPVRVEFMVNSEKDLSARVIRSTSGTVRIPEMGFLLEPGTMPESFVSNVEGVLTRFRGILEQAIRFNEQNFKVDLSQTGNHPDTEKRKRTLIQEHSEQARRGAQLLADLHESMDGKRPFTLVIDDPFGNSMIITGNEDGTESLKLKKRLLTDDEVNSLNKGIQIFELDDLAGIKERIK